MIDEIFRYMFDNTLAVQSRVITFASPAAAGGNAGSGEMIRLSKDEFNYDIERIHIDAKRAFCIRDQNSGTNVGEEEFEIVGQAEGPDELQRSGSGSRNRTFMKVSSADNSLIGNATFSGFGGTAASPTSINDWTSSVTVSSTNYSFDATNFFRPAPSDGTTSYAINIKATANLTQTLALRGTKLDPKIPYMFQVAYNRAVGSAAGTLLIRQGAVNNSVVLASQTGWNVLRAPATPTTNVWLRQFNEDNMDITIEWTRTSGDLLIDDALFVPGQFHDGTWYWFFPDAVAAYVEHRYRDEFTWSDSATDSKNQRWTWRAFNRYLPHSTGGGITWADAT